MQKILLILADGFEEIEALGTADILRRLQYDVVLAGLTSREVAASHGVRVAADMLLDEADPAEFAAAVLPGGLPGATNLLADDRVREILRSFHAQGKITAAICAAPIVLDRAGLLEGKKFTMYPAEALLGRLSGGKRPLADLVVGDGTVITGKGPGATPRFAAAIAEALGLDRGAIDREIAAMFF